MNAGDNTEGISARADDGAGADDAGGNTDL